MGDPKKQRKKYSTPRHPWEAERIKEEKVLLKEFGLKNKKEIWKMNSVLKNIKKQTKDIIGKRGLANNEVEEKNFLDKLTKFNLIQPGAKIADVLDIQMRDILERRLQTQLLRKGLAKTAKQARQFIVHCHIFVNGKMLDVPSYIVAKDEEHKIVFSANSALLDEEHPERVDKKKILEASQPKEEETSEESPSKEAPKEEVKVEAPKEVEKKETPEEKKAGDE